MMNYACLFYFILEEQKREREFYENEEKLAPSTAGLSHLVAFSLIVKGLLYLKLTVKRGVLHLNVTQKRLVSQRALST